MKSNVEKMSMRDTTERVNRYFDKNIDNIEDVSKGDLLWYLSTVFLWYDLEIDKKFLPSS